MQSVMQRSLAITRGWERAAGSMRNQFKELNWMRAAGDDRVPYKHGTRLNLGRPYVPERREGGSQGTSARRQCCISGHC